MKLPNLFFNLHLALMEIKQFRRKSLMFLKTIRWIGVIALLICLAGDIATAKIFDRIIAYVNNEVITQWELENLVRQRAVELQQEHRFSPREAMERATQEREELLDRLIRQLLLVETALTLKIEVTDEEIAHYIETFKQQAQIKTDEEFIKQLKREGLTLISFREQVQRNLMTEKLVMGRIRPKIQIRETDIQKFFEENRSQFSTKADEVQLRRIFIAFKPSEAVRKAALQKANAILQEVKAGKDFQILAQQHTEDEEAKQEAGILIERSLELIKNSPNPFRTVLSTLNASEISDPVENIDGIYLFKVANKTDKKIAFRFFVIPFKPSEEAITKANERADAVSQKLDQGEEFNLLAQQYSDDSETRETGGNLGIRSLNKLSREIRKIIEPLEAGQHTRPVKTLHGLYIYKIDSRAVPELNEIEKEQIRIHLSQKQFQEEWKAYTDLLLENSYIKINPLDEDKAEGKEDGKVGN
jgi:peptidyl-prolyl cis-trans isomerase SurA